MLISANGLSLYAETRGEGELAIVFLHFWGGTSATWRPVIDALPRQLRSIALDARGWGLSDRPDSGYTITSMADDVAGAIKELGLNRYLLVGHSMGGKVAQLLASRQPSGLVGLILVAPSPASGKTLSNGERDGMKGAYTSPESVGWTIDNILSERPLPAAEREELSAGALAGASAAKEAWPLAAIAEDVSADLQKIRVPILVIGAEKDKVDGIDMLQRVVMPALPGAVLKVIPDVGHLLPLEAPQEVAGEIAAFVERNARKLSGGATSNS